MSVKGVNKGNNIRKLPVTPRARSDQTNTSQQKVTISMPHITEQRGPRVSLKRMTELARIETSTVLAVGESSFVSQFNNEVLEVVSCSKKEAIERISRESPGIVFVELKENDLDVIRAIRANGFSGALIAKSQDVSPAWEEKNNFLSAGGDLLIGKNNPVNELLTPPKSPLVLERPLKGRYSQIDTILCTRAQEPFLGYDPNYPMEYLNMYLKDHRVLVAEPVQRNPDAVFAGFMDLIPQLNPIRSANDLPPINLFVFYEGNFQTTRQWAVQFQNILERIRKQDPRAIIFVGAELPREHSFANVMESLSSGLKGIASVIQDFNDQERNRLPDDVVPIKPAIECPGVYMPKSVFLDDLRAADIVLTGRATTTAEYLAKALLGGDLRTLAESNSNALNWLED